MKKFVPAFSSTIHIGLSTSVEGYVLPDSTFRYSPEYVSCLLGYAKNYISHLSKKSKKKLKALRKKGFTGEQILLRVSRPTGGATHPKLISFDDFCILVEYEAVEVRNPRAISLLTASFREMLRSRTQEAFDIPQDSIEEKIVKFEIDYQDCLEDREEMIDLKLYGNVELTEDIYGGNSFKISMSRY